MTTAIQMKLLRSLAAAGTLEKAASVAGQPAEAIESARLNHAGVLSEFVDGLKVAGDHPLQVVGQVLSLRDAQASVGVKLAADASMLEDATVKLAAAIVVDNALTAQLDVGTEQEKAATVDTRALGREYIAHLAQLLLS